VEWYSEVFQHDRFLQLRFVLRLEIRIVACQGDLLLLDGLCIGETPHHLFVTLVADPLVPRDHGGLVAR